MSRSKREIKMKTTGAQARRWLRREHGSCRREEVRERNPVLDGLPRHRIELISDFRHPRNLPRLDEGPLTGERKSFLQNAVRTELPTPLGKIMPKTNPEHLSLRSKHSNGLSLLLKEEEIFDILHSDPSENGLAVLPLRREKDLIINKDVTPSLGEIRSSVVVFAVDRKAAQLETHRPFSFWGVDDDSPSSDLDYSAFEGTWITTFGLIGHSCSEVVTEPFDFHRYYWFAFEEEPNYPKPADSY